MKRLALGTGLALLAAFAYAQSGSGLLGTAAYLILPETVSPADMPNHVHLFAKDKAGVAELFYRNDAGQERDLSASGGQGSPCDAWPVGSVFIGTDSTSPATSLGCGTWAAHGAGRVLVGFDAGQTEFDVDGETGGAKTHTLTSAEMPAHTHVQDAHTHLQNSHNHTQNSFAPRIINSGTAGTVGVQGASAASNANASNSATTATNQAATATNQNATATNQNTGGGGAHNNLQPYIVVRFWRRTG